MPMEVVELKMIECKHEVGDGVEENPVSWKTISSSGEVVQHYPVEYC